MTRPLKILQVSRVYWPNLGGMEKIAQGLAENLVERGHQCDVVTLNRSFEDGSDFPPYSHHNGVNVYRIPFRGSTRYPIAPKVLRFLNRYDIVHVHGIDFLLDWIVWNRGRHGKPVVLSTHGGFFHTDFFRQAKRLWFHTMTRNTFRGVDRVLASSEHDLEIFQAISDRCELARNAVDLTRYRALHNQPVSGRWVCVGRVDVHKGMSALLKTLAVLRDRGVSFSMHVIGPFVVDGLREQLEAERRQLKLEDEVVFEGRIEFDRLYELVETAELALFPSEYEAFGISVVEAMGAGVTSVLNDIEPFRHFVEDGVNGFLADYSTAESAADVIEKATRLGKKAKMSLGLKAREKALEYDWAATVQRFESLYWDVLENPR